MDSNGGYNEPRPMKEADHLLEVFLKASDEKDSEAILERLISEHAEPLIRTIIRSKLNLGSSFQQSRLQAETDDLCGDALVHLLSRVRSLKKNETSDAIRSFSDYVATITFHVCQSYISRRTPGRREMKNRLQYVLTHDPAFALWESNNQRFCGESSWRHRTDRMESLELARFAVDGAPSLSDQIASLFGRTQKPVLFESVVDHFCQSAGMDFASANPDQFPDSRTSIADSLDQREVLKALWEEICLLPIRQRLALLLSLRDSNRGSILPLFQLTNVAGFREIAARLEVTAEQLASWWNELPFEDAKIAGLLGLERQQIINLRKCARERIARRVQKGIGISRKL